MKNRHTRSNRYPITDEVRVWIVNCIRKINLTQDLLASESGVKRSWLSQVLSGRRHQAVDPNLMQRLQSGLAKALKESKAEGVQQLISELRVHFAAFVDNLQSLDDTSSASMRIAAELLEKLIQACPSKKQRLQVIKFLQIIVESD